MKRWNGKTIFTAVCLGLSLGLSGYAAFRPLSLPQPYAATVTVPPLPLPERGAP